MFNDLDDEDKVLEMENGWYLFGEAYIAPSDDVNVVLESLNSETDENAISVKEVKEKVVVDLLSEKSELIEPRGTTLPSETIVLGPGAEYTSSKFSGSGWRLSGYMFSPRPDTGYYLLWTTYVDDRRVGSIDQAYSTLHGTIQGDPIYNGVSKYINKATLAHVYYTYNPIAGTYYKVQNI